MKKGQVYTGQVEEVKFPNKGVVRVDDTEGETCVVKNVIKGQRIEFQVSKKKGGKCEGRLLNVLQKAENGLWGLMNTLGQKVINPVFSDIGAFGN